MEGIAKRTGKRTHIEKRIHIHNHRISTFLSVDGNGATYFLLKCKYLVTETQRVKKMSSSKKKKYR